MNDLHKFRKRKKIAPQGHFSAVGKVTKRAFKGKGISMSLSP